MKTQFKRSQVVWLTGLLFCWSCLSHAQNLRIYHIDVNQADATLFVTDSGESLLVDSGGNGAGDVIFSTMQQAGINTIHHYVTTHYHSDHYGGIDELVEDFDVPVLNAYDRGDTVHLKPDKLAEPRYREYQAAVGKRALHLTRGMTVQIAPGFTATCISSGGVVIGEEDPQPGHDENDMSVSLLINFHGFRYFVGGDIHQYVENKIAARDLVTNVDLYQANHHGSETSSAPALLQDMLPSVIVISNGDHGGYGHPQQLTLTNMQALQPAPVIYQTNKFLKLSSKPTAGNVKDPFIADLVPEGHEGTILCEVDVAARSYRVSSVNFSQDYTIKAIATNALVKITSILPDPVGSDLESEEVVLKNQGSQAVELSGWRLMDASGRIWPLGRFNSLAAGASITIRREGGAMSLNNEGDLIELLNVEGVVVDSFRYNGSVEGVRITTGH